MADSRNEDVKTEVIRIVTSLAKGEISVGVTLDSKLKHDLGLDSLNMLELCVAVEGSFNVSIEKNMSSLKTVGDILTVIENNSKYSAIADRRVADTFNVDDYPLPRAEKHIRKLKRYMRLSQFLWRFEVSGVENIPANGNYVLCPNHQSYLDSLWIWAAIGHERVNLHKICCLAAEVFLPRKNLLAMLGGIPVDRRGNTVPSMKRALDCIQNGYTMLIHPEGTRTRDGKMHEFKGGAAKLAIDANVPVIPVRIDGAWDIFPPHRKFPKLFRFGKRYPINIQFGKPIVPGGKSVDELTAMLQRTVAQMGSVL